MTRIDHAKRTMKDLCLKRGTLSVKDEVLMIERSTATRYLNNNNQAKRDTRITKQLKKDLSVEPRVTRSFENLDPYDPLDQLEGVDLSTPPWN